MTCTCNTRLYRGVEAFVSNMSEWYLNPKALIFFLLLFASSILADMQQLSVMQY